ncbi:MAG: spore maturation protein [Oscillospiraceae bacterium]|nr:spore maturation protein [Oscillospiraceae bacterium]MCC8079312.1 spore maturation protein [Oscillospiraceae bacterium]MCD8065863.1 spore maturation protein [Oscillospiraceae bacterium]MCD8375250.1 spore maturation protein [Oscillospiraceae bacterium]
MTALLVPLLVAAVCLLAALRRVDVFSALTQGAKSGLGVVAGMLPPLTVLLAGVYMLRASGALDALSRLCAPVLERLGIPPETAAILFIRPFSGSGALAVGSELIASLGADSFAGRCAAVMLGSTETTFYVISVYFPAAGIKKTRHAIPAALAADLTAFIVSAWAVRLFY